MSTSQPGPMPAWKALIDRCRALTLPTWVFDDNDDLLIEPTGWGPADQWLTVPYLRSMVMEKVNGDRSQHTHESLVMFDGCWLIPLQHHTPAGIRQRIVIMVMANEALHTKNFSIVCQKAGIDEAIARTSLQPLARYRAADVSRLVSTVQWMNQDLQHIETDTTAIESFSRELVETYEHISLLYRLSCSLNQLSEPAEFVELACNELHRTLEFDWVVAKFIPTTPIGEVLTDNLVVAGHMPCERRRVERLATTIARQMVAGEQPLLLREEDNQLAALVGAEVIADPIICNQQVTGILLAGNKGGLDPDVSSIDTQMLHATAEYLGSFVHSAASFDEQRTLFHGTIRAFTSTIDAKDRYTHGHSERVALLGAQIAHAAGLDKEMVLRVRLAGLLHDVGKIGIPETLLTKPGRLTEEEYEIIKRHPVIGFTILRDIRPLHDVLPGVLYHHERWDGGGYPQGLSEERIPILGRILAVADMFDAMSSDRSYRSALPRDEILKEIKAQSGSQLDPKFAKAFLTLNLGEYDRLIERHVARESEAA